MKSILWEHLPCDAAAAIADLQGLDRATIVRLRREKFMAIGRTLG